MRIRVITITVLFSLLAAASATAQVATPSARSPSTCRIEPRTSDAVTHILETGTPRPEVPIAELPKGEPADAETVAAITSLEQEFAACLNTNDWPRWLAFLTEDEVRHAVSGDEVAALFASAGTLEAGGGGDQGIKGVAVRDVRLLPDGRVRAIVVWSGTSDDMGPDIVLTYRETNLHLYRWVDGKWLRDEEVSDFVVPPFVDESASSDALPSGAQPVGSPEP